MDWYFAELWRNLQQAGEWALLLIMSRTVLEWVLLALLYILFQGFNMATRGFLGNLLFILLLALGATFLPVIGIYGLLTPFLSSWEWHIGTVVGLSLLIVGGMLIEEEYRLLHKVWGAMRAGLTRLRRA